MSLTKLIDPKHGLSLGSLKTSIPDALITDDKKIDLAPGIFIKALEDAFSNSDKHHTHELVKQLNEKKSALLEAVNALKKSKSEKSKEVVEDIKVIDDVSKIGVNALLHQLIEAVKTGDAVVCKKLTSQLEGYSLAAEKMEIVEKIGHSVKHYNFKATVVYINELLLLDKR